MRRYPASFKLIPLHTHEAKSKRFGRVMQDGKRPRDANWPRRKYDSRKTIESAESDNHNVGVRLTDEQLVLDIDPRNGGDEGFASLCFDLGLNPDHWPHVITGSGGHHYYLSKPKDVLVVDTLESYPGCEFKSRGRQVVAAGSIHPETHTHYVWDFEGADIEDPLPPCPRNLLNLIRRPDRVADGEGGTYSTEQIAKCLAVLDPCDFDSNDKWFPLIASVHHASGGEARQEFIDWSTSDERYRKDAYIIGRRWDSFHADKGDGYTSKTLEYHVRKAGHPELQVSSASNAADDFGDDDLPDDAGAGADFDFDTPATVAPVKWDVTKLPAMLDHAEAAMLAAGVPLYQMGGRLVHPVRTDADSSDAENVRRKAGSLTVQEVSALRLREYMVEHVPLYSVKTSRKGEKTRARFAAPMMLANHFLARQDRWRVPVLNGVIETPTLRRDGTLLDSDGYDPESGLLLDMGGMEYPAIPDKPTREDAESALALLQGPFKDFPFVRNAKGESPSQSVMLSAVLTGVVRRTLHSAPIHGTSAPTMGTGKTLAMDVVSLIVTGRLTTAMSQGASEEEDEKRLFSVLLQNDPILLIDNVKRPIEGDALCTILTQASWQSRILGENRKVAVPTNALFLASGNNLAFKGDMTTRALLCRMDARVERPETRRFDVDLKVQVPAQRPQLVAAALTVLRAFVVAGRPGLDKLTPFGRFEDWSNLVRGALVWLGEPDPCRTRNFIAVDDPEHNDFAQLIAAIQENVPDDHSWTAGELMKVAQDCTDDVLSEAIAGVVPKATTKNLGMYLKRHQGKIIGSTRLDAKHDTRRKLWVYKVKKV
jgi:hypothetical protein